MISVLLADLLVWKMFQLIPASASAEKNSQGRMLLYRFLPRFSGNRAESWLWFRPTSFRS